MKKNQKLILFLFALTLIILSTISIIFVYILNVSSEEKIKTEPFKQIDNRISPDILQALTIDLSRLRHRGLLEEIFKVSYVLKNPPRSYWRINVDGKECDSRGNIGYGSEGIFTEWDTILKDCRINFKIPDEQQKSDIVIQVFEEVKKGLFGLQKQDDLIEELKLTYNYKTGRWEGDDFFKDSDGYGHYLGKNVELWFNIYQSDYDHDGIPYWTEVNILGTNPMKDDSKLDPDRDQIPTNWEWKWKYDPFSWDDHSNLDPDLDGIENIEEYQMRNWYANPYQPDIYIETDGMQKKNIFDVKHIFHKDSQQMVIERFAQHGINVYIDDGWPEGPANGGGELLPFIDEIDGIIGGQIASYYQHHFPDERKGIFRYVFIANKLGWNVPSEYNKYDTILVFSGRRLNMKHFIAVTPRLKSILLAKGVLHELGHSMGLMPYTFNGVDIQKPVGSKYPSMSENEYKDYLEEYHSIMNYNYIYLDRKLFDYSDGSNDPTYDQNDWENLFLPTFQSDAIAVEESVDNDFEDFEVFYDEIYPRNKGWTMNTNITEHQKERFNSLVYSDLPIDINYIYFIKNDSKSERNVKIYAKPDIIPFPVVQQWTLIAEGILSSKDQFINLYSIDDKIDNINSLITQQ